MSVVPDAVVSFLLEKTTLIVEREYRLYADVKDNAKKLQDAARKLQGIIKDFKDFNHDSHYVASLLQTDMRPTLQEARETVTSYVDLVERHRRSKWITKQLQYFTIRNKAKQISDVLSKATTVIQDGLPIWNNFLQQEAAKRPANTSERKRRSVKEDQVIGFKDEAKHVRKLITREAKKFEVIAIVGMLGLGKSMLARKVLSDLNANDYITAFANVSKREEKEVFLDILEQIAKDSHDQGTQMSTEQLEIHLRDLLKEKKFVIVLDDVWSKLDWEKLEGAFPENEGCRVIITTCHNQVVEGENNSRIYKLNFLGQEDGLKLLRREIFEDENYPLPESLKKYAIQIRDRCDGLPLSIKASARALRAQVDDAKDLGRLSDGWTKVVSNLSDYTANDEETKKCIEKRYSSLESHLQDCFFYLGVFPEGFEIPVWKLVRLWIAEGFIIQEGRIDLEDTARTYLKELVRKNLVIVVQRRSNGNEKTVRLHRTLHVFCRMKAREKQLFHEIKQLNQESSDSSSLHCPRLCINNEVIVDNLNYKGSDCLHSLLAIPDAVPDTLPDAKSTTLPPEFVSSIPKKFKNVRVLEIQSHISSTSSGEFSKLIFLRYMGISSDFKQLPWKLAEMEDMQTLVVETISPTLEMDSGILTMKKLKHLHTNAPTIIRLEKKAAGPGWGSGNNNHLETLSTLAPESCTKDVFNQTRNLKKLVIGGDLTKLLKAEAGRGEQSLNNLGILRELENLKLLNWGKRFSILSWEESSFPLQITRLTLSGTRLEWKEMSKLGKMKHLEVLKLKKKAFQGKDWRTSEGGFDCLKYFLIDETNLMRWEITSGTHFPELTTLKIKNCLKLEELPDCMDFFAHVQLVVLENTTSELVKDAQGIQTLMLQGDKKIKAFELRFSQTYQFADD